MTEKICLKKPFLVHFRLKIPNLMRKMPRFAILKCHGSKIPNLPKMSKVPENENAIHAVALEQALLSFMAGIYYFRTLTVVVRVFLALTVTYHCNAIVFLLKMLLKRPEVQI